MAIIQSGDSSKNSLATVDPTVKSLNATPYSTGQNPPQPANVLQKYTYSAATTAFFHDSTISNANLVIGVLQGSGEKIIRLNRIVVCPATGTVQYLEIALNKDIRSTQETFANAIQTARLAIPMDANSPPATCGYVGNPPSAFSLSTSGKPLLSINQYSPVSSTNLRKPSVYDFNFRHQPEAQRPTLRSTAEILAVTNVTAISSVGSLWFTMSFEWTEE
jgi:hypothetical protein